MDFFQKLVKIWRMIWHFCWWLTVKLCSGYQLCKVVMIFPFQHVISIIIEIGQYVTSIIGEINFVSLSPNFHIDQHNKHVYIIVELQKYDWNSIFRTIMTKVSISYGIHNICHVFAVFVHFLKTFIKVIIHIMIGNDYCFHIKRLFIRIVRLLKWFARFN